MVVIHLGAALIAAVLGQAVATLTAAREEAPFRVSGVEFVASIPAGFCVPRGAGLDIAQMVAAADSTNVTDLALFTCGDEKLTLPDYYIVKTPKAALLANVPREEFLAAMGKEFDKPEFAAAIAAGTFNEQAVKSFNEMTGAEAGITGSIKPLGRDETCAYLGGILKFEAGPISYTRAVGACMTTVSGRILVIYRYGAADGVKSVVALSAKSKAFAKDIRVKE